MFGTVVIIGVGLIGGSIGLALKERKLARQITGVGRRAEKLRVARQRGAIDDYALEIPAGSIDLAIVCTPVDQIAERVLAVARPGILITDAGSTKAGIVAAIEPHLPAGAAFVGSHPIAGSEKSGPEHAVSNLFQGRLCVVTPTARSAPEATQRIETLWQQLGMHVERRTPEEHDRILGRTSHLPHLAATALTLTLEADDAALVGTGFRDTTRIAAGDAHLWRAICAQNRAALLPILQTYQATLQQLLTALELRDDDTLEKLLGDGKRIRDNLGS